MFLDWSAKDILPLVKDSTLAAVVIYYLYTNNRKKPPVPIILAAGEMPTDYWDKRFDEILLMVKETYKLIEKQGESQTEVIRDLTKAITELMTAMIRQSH